MSKKAADIHTKKPTSKYKKAVVEFLTKHMVTIMFIVLSIIGLYLSGMNSTLYLTDIISRVSRNSFLVLALIIPVIAGMGLNFSIVLGAMAAQAIIIFVTDWGVVGFPGILLCIVLVTPLSILLGYMTGKLFNRTKGQEMITGLILGFFAAGIYWFIFLQLVGGVIPMDNEVLLLSSGVGIRTTIDLTGGLRYGLDDVYRLSLPIMIVIIGGIMALYQGVSFIGSDKEGDAKSRFYFGIVLAVAFIVGGIIIISSGSMINNIRVPVATWIAIAGLCIFLTFFSRTKLGQDMRTVGQDRHIAAVSGIEVDKVRIIAIIFSTVFASWGHIIFLQNMGAWSTYGSHEQIGFYAIAAILIGGATVSKATIGQALLGVFLFHTLFIVAPAAGRELYGDAQIGEYFRVFVAYGVIGAALALHAWKTRLQSKQKLGA
ncbi:MAG: ABC transporter permease [Bacillota bacterium]|nr:ABC transporter permease [Bacillota bacterium]